MKAKNKRVNSTDNTQMLDSEEVANISLLTEKIQNKKLAALVITKDIEIRKRESNILENSKKILELEILNMGLSLNHAQRQIDEDKNIYREYIKNLSEKYGLPEKWGYDPISGEITLETQEKLEQ